MAITNRVREIEKEIDAGIRALTIWQAAKADVTGKIMMAYRDGVELAFVKLLDAKMFGYPGDCGDAFMLEDLTRSGVLWALKWASEYCPEIGPACTSLPDDLAELIFLGRTYQAFVDALKYGDRGLITIEVDESSRIITCYEGGNVTAFDVAIIHQGTISMPPTPHFRLTEDGDQITSRWTAGDYRRVTKTLANYAASQEMNTIQLAPEVCVMLGKGEISVPQPAVVWLERPSVSPDCCVFDDLVLQTVMDSPLKWRLVTLLDTPIVMVGHRYCALSSDLKAISVMDDYMLRLAARVDEQQYCLVSGLRENRMIRICRRVLENCGRPWTVKECVPFANPDGEADIVAERGSESLLLELKSTLRPEIPWEMYKRNKDIIDGVTQARNLIDRGVSGRGFVVTDGYRGNYACWSEALTSGIPIATLYDLEVIADDPESAVSEIKRRVGITNVASSFPARLSDREGPLLSWKLRLVDTKTPQERITVSPHN